MRKSQCLLLMLAVSVVFSATGAFAQDEAAQSMHDELRQLRQQVQELQELRSEERQQWRYLIMLSDPDLASLAALHHANNLEPRRRIELLIAVLDQPEHSRVVRNAAHLMLIEVLQAEGRMDESVEAMQRMMNENAHNSPPTWGGPGERVDPERYPQDQRAPQRQEPWPRMGTYYGDPTGRRLEHEMRSPRIYRGHPDDYLPYDPFFHQWRPRYYRDFFDRPWFDDPRWRPHWWQ